MQTKKIYSISIQKSKLKPSQELMSNVTWDFWLPSINNNSLYFLQLLLQSFQDRKKSRVKKAFTFQRSFGFGISQVWTHFSSLAIIQASSIRTDMNLYFQTFLLILIYCILTVFWCLCPLEQTVLTLWVRELNL